MSRLSVVIPAFNEGDGIENTFEVIKTVLINAGINYEIVFVDDGSKDNTWDKITKISCDNSNVVGVRFSRNFGKESAILAGLTESKGDCCVVIDSDLQHPPEIIEQMFVLWQEGYDVVNGVKSSRGKESFLHKFSAKTFYSIMSSIVQIDMRHASDYKLLDRKVVDELIKMPERSYFFRALSEWVGFTSISIEYDVAEREHGTSKWSTYSLIKYATRNITSFSSFPLHLITSLGIIVLVIALIIGIIALVQYFNGEAVEGFTTVILLILIMGSMIMISLGIIGHYISKIYDEIKQRPKYIISKKLLNTDQDE